MISTNYYASIHLDANFTISVFCIWSNYIFLLGLLGRSVRLDILSYSKWHTNMITHDLGEVEDVTVRYYQIFKS